MNNGLDNEGYIINQASYSLVDSEYKSVFNYFIEKITEKNLISKLHSLYCYGSVAKGKAIKYQSDLDLIVITNQDLEPNQIDLIEQIKKETLLKFDFITKIDMPVCKLDDLFNLENKYKIAFRIKNSSVCILGNALNSLIMKVKPNKEIALVFNHDILELTEKYKTYFKKVNDQKILKLLSKQISKKIIRSLFGSIIEEKHL